MKATVVVGMSGGVDSSVTALLLKQQGYHVIGMFMKNWEETDSQGNCKASTEFEDVVRVCEQIGIPYYSVNFVKEYWDNVFSHCLNEFKLGFTPNPDILCNREIKFKALLQKALEFGADKLATGHYCQIQHYTNRPHLIKGSDSSKDQSYFLYAVQESSLSKVLFPIGNMPKSQVRAIAKQYNLATAEKKDSTGICFIGKRPFKEFLTQYIPNHPGQFEDLDGNPLGTHDGTAYYTIGQRKGLGIGGPGEAWFVVDKDLQRNAVILAQGAEHPALYCDELYATELIWISGTPPQLPYTCHAKIRYRQPDQLCTLLSIDNDRAHVRFATPQRAATPRQSIVFYDKDHCLGGGMIHSTGPTHYQQKKSR